MKKLFWNFILLLTITSCMEDNNLCSTHGNSQEVENIALTRTVGDGKYSALGYGYDITDDYLGEKSIRLQVIDVESFVATGDNKYRFDNPFLGIIDQNCYAGENAYTFLKDITTKSNFSGSIAASIPGVDITKNIFSSTINKGFTSQTKYSYSSKYSFARAELVKKQRQYYLHADVDSLAKYLTPIFKKDIEEKPVDSIVAWYGTHVMTDIIVGGKYTAYYKSAIIKENNYKSKTKTVDAGAKFNMKVTGLDADGSWSRTEITEENKKNSKWECHIKSVGGKTIGAIITLTPDKGPTQTIDLGAWSASVDDEHSRLVEVDWNKTYPIYDFVADPIKKAELKSAVTRYLNNKKIDIIKLLPLYQYYSEKYVNHSYCTNWRGEVNGTDRYEGVIAYICQDRLPGTSPLYEYYSEKYVNHSYCTNWRGEVDGSDRYNGTLGYIYQTQIPNTYPLYLYYSKKYIDHSIGTNWRGIESGTDYYQGTLGYVY